MCRHVYARVLITTCRKLLRTFHLSHFSVGLALLGIVLAAAAPSAQADPWINSGAVIYQFQDSGLGGRTSKFGGGSAAALYGTRVEDSLGTVYTNYQGLDAAQAAPHIFDADYVGGPFPRDFISLPSDPGAGNFTYIMVGYDGKVVVPQPPVGGSRVYEVRVPEFDNKSETAWLYVSNKMVSDPADLVFDPTDPNDDFDRVLGGVFVASSGPYDELLAGENNAVDLYGAHNENGDPFRDPIQAIVIEGRDALGHSYGFDVMSVQFWGTALSDTAPGVPEPASAVLLSVGGLALLCFRRRRRKR